MGGANPGQVDLEGIRKVAEEPRGNKPGSSIPSWSVLKLLPGFPHGLQLIRRERKPFPFTSCFWSVFVTGKKKKEN